ncbi:MAG: ATP-dependent helicase [Spirochaetales bacterium]|nr:ATP-dependent helicase [Spirochaetales bacterium]
MNPVSNLSDADREISSCLNLDSPKSFFLFAGAGSGKTRSLVNVLQEFRKSKARLLALRGQKVAVITYTNAACDEIKRRLEFDNTFIVSTIHSFSWELIKPFQNDIRNWVRDNLNKEISELEAKQGTGRAGTKAASDRAIQIESKRKRLDNIETVKKFSYDPNGTNTGRDSLNHAEVISITATFLTEKNLMMQLLINKYPILLIDESQDTKKELMEAFFNVQNNYKCNFSLGIFCDTMQRIYTDGKIDLGNNLPDDWSKPVKLINHRCPKRIITLINKIRSVVDSHIQKPSNTNEEGFVKLFIVNTKGAIDKLETEKSIMQQMQNLTKDAGWDSSNADVKILTLEHHMAARRGGFLDFFEPLYRIEKYKTGLLDGTLTGVSFFIQQVIPLIQAKRDDNKFKVAQIIRKHSPLLSSKILSESKNQLDEIKNADTAVNGVYNLFKKENQKPKLLDILSNIDSSGLLTIPDVFAQTLKRKYTENRLDEDDATDKEEAVDAWDNALKCSFDQIIAYSEYITDKSMFGTHQGVKGLEFPRVLLILDDEEARGFMFSYDKLFGTKPLTDTDKKNISEGKETSIDRTRRLFYVTCSRTEKSLAIVAYTKNSDAVKNQVLKNGWFSENEVVLL